MKIHVMIMFLCLVGLCGSTASAQVSFTDQDIPVAPGTVFEYLVESDAAVDVGSPGESQHWDFTQMGTFSVQTEEIVDPLTSPFYILFPAANKVSFGPVPFGLADGTAWRYDRVTSSQWTVLGISLYQEAIGEDFPFPIQAPLMPLPLEFNDTWGLNLYREETIDVDDIPYPIPAFDEIRLEITIQGDNTCDGWGTVTLPGGTVDALRVYTNIGGHVDAVGIYYLFGLPIEVPLGEVFRLDVSKVYSWYSPGYGEVAFALSYPGETDPNFTSASAVRRQNIGETPETIVLDAAALNAPVVIPATGGAFDWSIGITSTYQTTFTGVIWSTATLPNGTEYFIESVNVNLPAQADIFVPLLSQNVPGGAPAGDYVFNVFAGPDLTQPIAHDSFELSKLAGVTTGRTVNGWWGGSMKPLDIALEGFQVKEVPSPADLVLRGAYPNPFNPSTRVEFELNRQRAVSLQVFDLQGRLVSNLLNSDVFPEGRHSVRWDGTDDAGSRVASGPYFFRLEAGGQVETKRGVLIK